jgi:hypothetical protein
MNFSDPAVANDLRRPAESVLGTLLGTDLKDHAILPGGVTHQATFPNGEGHRFLTIDMFTGPHGRQGTESVPMVRCHHKNPVNIGPLTDFLYSR